MRSEAHGFRLQGAGGVVLQASVCPVKAPRAIVVIVHGLCEHSSRYEYVAGVLNDCGYTVYRYDLRGHGLSGGARGYLRDFRQYLDDTERLVELVHQENPGCAIFMLGHSMGGFIAAASGVMYPQRLAGQILSGPAVIVLPIFEDYLDIDIEAEPKKPVANALADLISRDARVVEAYKKDPLVLKAFTQKLLGEVFLTGARWLMENVASYRYPCLILHGGDDRIVTPEAARFLYDNIDSADRQLRIYDGLYPEILNEPERDRVLSDIREWIDARLTV